MAFPAAASTQSLYNNPHLSDIKILQINDDDVNEYYAHKAILANQSDWFYRVFSGGFRESIAKVIPLHEDDPVHFEAIMKYLYKHDWDNALLGIEEREDLCMEIVQVHNLGEKYAIRGLTDALMSKYPSSRVFSINSDSAKALADLTVTHYDHCAHKECGIGQAIARDWLELLKWLRHHHFHLIEEYPRLARDILLVASRANISIQVPSSP